MRRVISEPVPVGDISKSIIPRRQRKGSSPPPSSRRLHRDGVSNPLGKIPGQFYVAYMGSIKPEFNRSVILDTGHLSFLRGAIRTKSVPHRPKTATLVPSAHRPS